MISPKHLELMHLQVWWVNIYLLLSPKLALKLTWPKMYLSLFNMQLTVLGRWNKSLVGLADDATYYLGDNTWKS